MVEPSPRERQVVGTIPDPVIPNTLKILVAYAFLLSAQHIYMDMSGFSLLLNLVKIDWLHLESRVINILSENNLLYNRP